MNKFWKKITLNLIPIFIGTTLVSCKNSTNLNTNYFQTDNNGIMFLLKQNNMIVLKTFEKFENTKISDIYLVNNKNKKVLYPNFELSYINNKESCFVINEISNYEKGFIIKSKTNSNIGVLIDNLQKFEIENLKKGNQYFFDLIKDMANNSITTIIEVIDSPAILQQSFFISLFNFFSNLKQRNELYDKTIMVCDNNIWNRKWVNFKALSKQNIWNGVKDLNLINSENNAIFNLINNNQIFSSSKNYISYNDTIRQKFNIKKGKIDFVIPDVNLKYIFDEFLSNSENSKLEYILKNANKIIVLSEGAAHTNLVVPFFENLIKKIHVMPRNETIQKLIDFQNEVKGKININDILNFVILKNFEIQNPNSKFSFFNFVNYDGNILNSLDLIDSKKWTENSISFNFLDYANLLKDGGGGI